MRRLITLFALFALVLVAQAPAGAIEGELPRDSAAFNDEVRKVEYAGDVVYAGGKFSHALTTTGSYLRRDHLAAVDATTGALLPFAPRVDGQIYDLATSSQYLYASGTFRTIDDVSIPRLARFHLDTGELDADWRPNPSATVFAIEPVGDVVYLGGRFGSVGGFQQPRLAAVSADDGAPVESFTPRVQEGAVRDIEMGHGRLYASGGFTYVEDEKRHGKLAAFDPESGQLDRSFDARVYVLTRQIAIDGDRVYGALDGRGGQVRAFDTSGEALWYQAADGGMQAVAVWNGVVIGGGHFDEACVTDHAGPLGECLDGVEAARGKFIAMDLDGNLLPWNPGANGVIGVWDLKVHPEGRSLAAAGTFTTFGGGAVQQQRFAIFE